MKLPDLHITMKTFLLLVFFILCIPLFFAAQSLVGGGGSTSTLDVTVNQSSDWSHVSFDGATISGISIIRAPGLVGYNHDTLMVNGSGITQVRVSLSNIPDTVKISLDKDSTGTASAAIAGVGTLDNVQESIPIPITLSTNSTTAAIRLTGMEIDHATITSLSGTDQLPVIDRNLILLQNPSGQNAGVSLTAYATFTQDRPLITVEKGDGGIADAMVDHYEYVNDQQGQTTVSNLPVTLEMTSNMTQIFFNNASITQGKILTVDNQNSAENIIGDSFLYLKYPDTDNTFHRATYILDLNANDQSTITAYKNNEGFVHISVGNNDYFVAGQSDIHPYVNSTYYLGVPKFTQKATSATSVTTTGSIDTTSDWTDVTFQGLDGLILTVTGTQGNIVEPTQSGNTLSILKTTSKHTTPAHVDFTLTAQNEDNAKLIIEKGDLGYTTVTLGDNAAFSNAQTVNGDPTNRVAFDLPQLPLSPYQEITVQRNPEVYYFPADGVTTQMGTTIGATQPAPSTLILSKSTLPGFRVNLQKSVAAGIVAFVGISWIVLGIFGLTILRKDGFFSFVPRRTISTEFLWKLALGTLEKLEVSSLLIIEAIISLAVTPFLLMYSETLAEGVAILAYLLLVAGVVVRILEMKERFTRDKEKCMALKLEALVILLTAGYIGGFELLSSPLGKIALIGMGLITLFYLWIVYLYVNRDLYEFSLN
jgi:hypothetical protein